MWEGERAQKKGKKKKHTHTQQSKGGREKEEKKKIAGLRKACPQRVYNSYNDVDNSCKPIVFSL